MPEEGESIDAVEIKKICKDFIKKHKDALYYEQIARFAEKKLKQIEYTEAQEKKLKKLTKKK